MLVCRESPLSLLEMYVPQLSWSCFSKHKTAIRHLPELEPVPVSQAPGWSENRCREVTVLHTLGKRAAPAPVLASRRLHTSQGSHSLTERRASRGDLSVASLLVSDH